MTIDQTAEQARIKAFYEQIYDSGDYNAQDSAVASKIRGIVRKHIWPRVKFLKGEGHFVIIAGKNGRNKKRKATLKVGYSHEKPDLSRNAPRGYQWEIMRLLNKENDTDEEKAMFWKTYESVVRDVIQGMRSNKAVAIKQCLLEGEECLFAIELLILHIQ